MNAETFRALMLENKVGGANKKLRTLHTQKTPRQAAKERVLVGFSLGLSPCLCEYELLMFVAMARVGDRP